MLRAGNNNLTSIPDLSCAGGSLTHLKLENNFIASINDSFTGLEALRNLDIRNNLLTALYSHQFDGQGMPLYTLSLSDNPISSIDSNAFCGTQLRYLYMWRLYLTSLPDLSCIAGGLRAFQATAMQSTGLVDFSAAVELPAMINLALELSVQPGRDQLRLMTHTTKLQLICYGLRRLTQLDTHFLQHVPALEILRIQVGGFRVMPDFSVIPATNQITELQMNWGWLEVVPTYALRTLRQLTTLQLMFNRISEIQPRAFLAQYHVLTSLDLEGNSDLDVDPVEFSQFTSLETVTLDNTGLTEFPDFSGSASALESLSMKNVNITKPLLYLNASFSQLSHVGLRAGIATPVALADATGIILAGTLERLDLRNNTLSCHCENAWIVRLLRGEHGQQYDDVIDVDGTVCGSPAALRGRSVQDDVTVADMCPGKSFALSVSHAKCGLC